MLSKINIYSLFRRKGRMENRVNRWGLTKVEIFPRLRETIKYFE